MQNEIKTEEVVVAKNKVFVCPSDPAEAAQCDSCQ
jgi:hypothetical protein